MAYKQKGCSPITAKIKRTTQGGMITQPILNMGAPVKMKADSPAKQGGRSRVANKPSPKASASDKIKRQEREKAENKIRQAHIDRYKNNPNLTASDKKSLKDVQRKIESTSSYKDGVAAKSQKANQAAKQTKSAYTPVRTDNANPVPSAFRPDATLNGGSKSGIKGAMGSKLRKNEYDKKGWAYDETISTKSLATNDRPIAKTMETPKQRKVKKVAPKAVKIETKVSASKPKSKKEIRTAKSVERKSSRASNVRAKGEAALASGNLAKARRLKRREERIKKRAAKRASK